MSAKPNTQTPVEPEAATEVEVMAPETEAATLPLAKHQPTPTLAFNVKDIDIPRLNVIQKMSQIEGPIGSCVFDQETVLFETGTKIPVIILGATKRFKEDVPYDDDKVPQSVDTEEEARALATSSDYDVIEYAEIIMLIPQIGPDDTNFPYPIGDTNYQIGRITVQKDAYRMTYKRLVTFQTFNRAIPVSSRLWDFSTELMTKGKYSWYVPTLAITKLETPAAVAEFVADLTNG